MKEGKGMTYVYPNWLSKQMMTGVKGFNIDAYLIALEGWRRGLTLKWYFDPEVVTDLKIIGSQPLGKTFSLQSDDKKHFFYRSRGEKVMNEAVSLTTSKEETKKYLHQSNVNTPESKGFTEEDNDEAILKYGMDLGFPLVIKPICGSLGKGVVTNIQNETELKDSIRYVRSELSYPDVLVERFVDGVDYRIYVAGDKVLAATKRLPAFVVGDGESSIEKLVEEKNNQRKENPYLSKKTIAFDQDLFQSIKKQGHILQGIPELNELVYLKGQSNIAAGGEPIDVTDEISPEVKNIAIQAVKAIPGLEHAGVDVIVSNNHPTVIEINATADIGMHVFPLHGESRNVPEGIIDYYFPETKGMAQDRTQIFFDYKKIRELFVSKIVQEAVIPDAPKGKLYAKRYVISGKVQKVGYRNWVRRQALKHHLNGYTRNLKNGKVVVVVGSEDKEAVDNFKEVCYKGPARAKVEDVQEYLWENQVCIGFEVRRKNKVAKNK